jgi:hypothetical protein
LHGHTVNSLKVFTESLDGRSQSQFLQDAGTKPARNSSNFVMRSCTHFAQVVRQVSRRREILGRLDRAQPHQHGGQLLTDVVVQVAGNPRSLSFLTFE